MATGSDDTVEWVILGPNSRVDARCDKPINKSGDEGLNIDMLLLHYFLFMSR